ncbi:unnamed protein product [Cuscuta europaea]|uniref:Zinc finger PHD-type domain-containing protein n=1 Tax=Cuscuta europaea TaxID=41803 RepID=A0A9P0Z3T6_CUSEU|nr:unnamed protein product [Cuscuta europaea]
MMRPDFSSPGSVVAGCTVCGNCGAAERLILHGIRLRGNIRKLCTTCVLRLHPQYFCPTCFTVSHPSPPRSSQNDAVCCSKCYSVSHTQCVGHTPPNPYVCPLCVSPNSPIFTLRKATNVDGKSGETCRVIDKSAARVLLAAARIAATLMSGAAASLRMEAEKKAKEAAFSRKRAREALEHVSYLAAKEKLMRNEVLLAKRGGIGGIASNSVMVNNHREYMDRADTSIDVLAALNKDLAGVQLPNNIVPMVVEENGGFSVGLDTHTGLSIVQNLDESHQNGMPENLAEFTITNSQELRINSGVAITNGQELRINSGVASFPAAVDQDQQTNLILSGEQNNGVKLGTSE